MSKLLFYFYLLGLLIPKKDILYKVRDVSKNRVKRRTKQQNKTQTSVGQAFSNHDM